MRPKILLVDDRAENLIALEAILSALNQQLVHARSSEQAVPADLHLKHRQLRDQAELLRQPEAATDDVLSDGWPSLTATPGGSATHWTPQRRRLARPTSP